jgi:hypothetical protein
MQLLEQVWSAQETFRAGAGQGAYASTWASLIDGCDGRAAGPLPAGALADVTAAGYRVTLRPASGAWSAADCAGHPTVSEYFVSVEPHSTASPAQEAFAMSADGRQFMFGDGVAPNERDIAPGGLAALVKRRGMSSPQ